MANHTVETFEKVHVSNVRPGGTVLFDGVLKTVCSKDLRRDDFYGVTLWGDSFRMGTLPVLRVARLSSVK